MDLTGIGSLFDAATSIVNKIFPDKTQEEKDKAAKEMAEIMNEHNLVQGQLDINKAEASSTNWFVAGWRPACGWIGALGLGYASILEPIARFIVNLNHIQMTFPVLDTTITMQVLFGMLGLGVMRTVEKKSGTEGNR